jgi:hypothetical protein
MGATTFTTLAAIRQRSSRSDRAPHVANFVIEMIGGGSLGRPDQKGLDARIDHKAGFFALVEVQSFENFDQPTD